MDGGARRPSLHPRPRALEHPLGVVSRRRRLEHGRLPLLREEPGEEDRGLDLCGRDRQLVCDATEPRSLDDERRVAVGGRHQRAHPAERLADTLHRTRGERGVADELEPPGLPGEHAAEQAHERACVAAVERTGWVRLGETPQADALHLQRVDVLLVDLRAERSHRRDRRLGVLRAAEPADDRLALAERADQHRPVGDRLVPRHGDVAHEGGDGVDAHRRAEP